MGFDITAAGERKVDYPLLSSYGVGAAGIASPSLGYVTAKHFGVAPNFQTVLYFAGLPVLTGNTTGASFGSKQVFTFPQARVRIDNVNAYFKTIAFNAAAGGAGNISQTGSGDYSMGSAATADATLAGTDVDLLPSTAMLDPFVAGATAERHRIGELQVPDIVLGDAGER